MSYWVIKLTHLELVNTHTWSCSRHPEVNDSVGDLNISISLLSFLFFFVWLSFLVIRMKNKKNIRRNWVLFLLQTISNRLLYKYENLPQAKKKLQARFLNINNLRKWTIIEIWISWSGNCDDKDFHCGKHQLGSCTLHIVGFAADLTFVGFWNYLKEMGCTALFLGDHWQGLHVNSHCSSHALTWSAEVQASMPTAITHPQQYKYATSVMYSESILSVKLHRKK